MVDVAAHNRYCPVEAPQVAVWPSSESCVAEPLIVSCGCALPKVQSIEAPYPVAALVAPQVEGPNGSGLWLT